jgi:hypothetical protein
MYMYNIWHSAFKVYKFSKDARLWNIPAIQLCTEIVYKTLEKTFGLPLGGKIIHLLWAGLQLYAINKLCKLHMLCPSAAKKPD